MEEQYQWWRGTRVTYPSKERCIVRTGDENVIYQNGMQLGLFLQRAGICMGTGVFVRVFIVIESYCLLLNMY